MSDVTDPEPAHHESSNALMKGECRTSKCQWESWSGLARTLCMLIIEVGSDIVGFDDEQEWLISMNIKPL